MKFKILSDEPCVTGPGRGHSVRAEALRVGSMWMGTSKSTVLFLSRTSRVTDVSQIELQVPPSEVTFFQRDLCFLTHDEVIPVFSRSDRTD